MESYIKRRVTRIGYQKRGMNWVFVPYKRSYKMVMKRKL